jgi:small subunit ribosomal protein S21
MTSYTAPPFAFFEALENGTPSERRVRERAEAICRARKLARKKMQREGLLPMKPRVIPGAAGRGGPARPARF